MKTGTKAEKTYRVKIHVRHGLLYDVIDTGNTLVSGRQFPELVSNLRKWDWRFWQTPALGIESPKTGKILWIARPVWFLDRYFAHAVYPVLRPTFDEWSQDTFERELTTKQMKVALKVALKFQDRGFAGPDGYCSYDDCPVSESYDATEDMDGEAGPFLFQGLPYIPQTARFSPF